MDLQSVFQKYVLKLETTFDVDTTDRFKYTYTTWILVVSALIAMASSFLDNPMSCWVPDQFHGSWKQYVENYCYIEGSYFVPMNNSNLPDSSEKMYSKISYYQWVPFILVFYAVVTYSPRLLWKKMQSFQDVKIASLTSVSRKEAQRSLYTSSTYELCDKQRGEEVLDLIHRWKVGNLLTASLLFTKIVSLIVIFLQTMSLDWFLSGKVLNFYGFRLLHDILTDKDWRTSGLFPRTTFCDVQVRELGSVQTWTVQCVLKANMYYEKLFLFIWFWYFALTVISIVNFVKWLHWSVPFNQVSFLKEVVQVFDEDASLPRVRRLFRKLHSDGTTIVRLISENANLYSAAKYLKPIWDAMEDLKYE